MKLTIDVDMVCESSRNKKTLMLRSIRVAGVCVCHIYIYI